MKDSDQRVTYIGSNVAVGMIHGYVECTECGREGYQVFMERNNMQTSVCEVCVVWCSCGQLSLRRPGEVTNLGNVGQH